MSHTVRNSGMVLPLAVIAMVILTIAGMATLNVGFQSRARQIRIDAEIAARSAADAALVRAISEMNALFAAGTLGDPLPEESPMPLEGGDAEYSYCVTRNGGSYTVTATGRSNGAQHSVEAVLDLTSPFDWAIFTQGGIELKNSAVVDWYNHKPGDAPLKIGTNSTGSGDITLKNSARVNGDVVVGAGGDPDRVIDTGNGAVITGDTYAMGQEYTPPATVIPEWLMWSAPQGSIDDSATLSASGKYDAIELGNKDVLTIDGDVTIYVKKIKLGNSSEIVIPDGSSLVIYLDGELEGKNSSGFNNQSEDPKNLIIYGTGACTAIELKNSSSFYGAIHAPEAQIEIKNSGNIYGSLIVESIELKNSARFFYDASLRTVQSNMSSFKISRWRE